MSTSRGAEYLLGLVRELCKLPKETEWLEFKHNHAEPDEIGEYVSAIANSAALVGRERGYVLWGIEDGSHRAVGTSFLPAERRVGNELLESWLVRLLEPRLDLRFHEVTVGDGSNLVLLEIPRAFHHPVRFKGQEYIRVGSSKKKLKDYPEKERSLWRAFDQRPFEMGIAAAGMTEEEALQSLDYPSYFELHQRSIPDGRARILETLREDGIVGTDDAKRWGITSLGAILFAKRLADFPTVQRKSVRVVQYRGTSRVDSVREQAGTNGYASGFRGLMDYITGLLPSNEVIRRAVRETVPMYPQFAVRELIANALIHQDFFISGAGPLVGFFDDRMEISNPGIPLVATERFLDSPPRSRNEILASMMRRMGICEERGSGVDKVVSQTELFQLPAPLFEVAGEGTRAVLFAPRALGRMDKTDRIRACYLHACLKYVNRDFLTNTSIRERFGIEPANKAIASRYIREALDVGVIKLQDEAAAPKLRRYVPFWA